MSLSPSGLCALEKCRANGQGRGLNGPPDAGLQGPGHTGSKLKSRARRGTAAEGPPPFVGKRPGSSWRPGGQESARTRGERGAVGGQHSDKVSHAGGQGAALGDRC